MKNVKNIIKNMITCIILERTMHSNLFIMMKINVSMTRYQVTIWRFHFLNTKNRCRRIITFDFEM